MTQTALVSLGSVALSTPAVGHYVDASLPLGNWSFDWELGCSSLHSFVKREEVVGTCFAVVVVAAVVAAAVEEVETTVVVVADQRWPVKQLAFVVSDSASHAAYSAAQH